MKCNATLSLSQPDCCWFLIHTNRVNDAFQCHCSEFLFIPLFCSCALSEVCDTRSRQFAFGWLTFFTSPLQHPQRPQQENDFHLLCPFIRHLLGCIEPALKEMAFHARRFVTGSDAYRSVVRFLNRLSCVMALGAGWHACWRFTVMTSSNLPLPLRLMHHCVLTWVRCKGTSPLGHGEIKKGQKFEAKQMLH